MRKSLDQLQQLTNINLLFQVFSNVLLWVIVCDGESCCTMSSVQMRDSLPFGPLYLLNKVGQLGKTFPTTHEKEAYSILSCFFFLSNRPLIKWWKLLTFSISLEKESQAYCLKQVKWSGIPMILRIFHRLWFTQSKDLA